jgi:hypothetical protein
MKLEMVTGFRLMTISSPITHSGTSIHYVGFTPSLFSVASSHPKLLRHPQAVVIRLMFSAMRVMAFRAA